ncbi:DNA polymerase [Ornithinibacillus sp. 4-3]|uniref:DNA-directed DNA polymerase n=1 Tax=Ornithinibacillus sp. 4-3 TaxID=3231488 RepID=A0AB39HJ30_9BACI
MRLEYTSISNLLLLPKNFSIEEHDPLVSEILESHHVFHPLYELEKSIQLILDSMEKRGLVIAEEWFRSGLEGKRTQRTKAVTEINQYVDGAHDDVDESRLHDYWRGNNLPIANSFDALANYKQLHPTYNLMLQYRKHSNYLKQWDLNLKHDGVELENGDVRMKGKWQSFASYTGRMSAKQLPLTSLPSEMRDYIVPPKDSQLVSIDLNNAELRFLAYYAKCDQLIQRFNAGEDIHYETAKLIQSKMNRHKVADEQARELAKRYTYSFLYGAGVKTIQKSLQKVFKGITSADVVTINDAFIQQYPEIQSFLLEREKSDSLLTAFGEVKPIAKFYEAQKRNFTLQSSVSVAIKMLMKTLANHKIEIMHALHDEVWISIPIETNLSTLMDEVATEFEEKIKNTFRGFPCKGLLTIEKIGGKIQ